MSEAVRLKQERLAEIDTRRGSDSLIGSNLTESYLSDLPKIPLQIPIFR
jgi:hypothetical protein